MERALSTWRIPADSGRKTLASSLGESWCKLMHRNVTWPVNGQYECQTCYRTYQVPWEEPAPALSVKVTPLRHRRAVRPAAA